MSSQSFDSGPAITLADDPRATKTLPTDPELHQSAEGAELMFLNNTSAQKHGCTATQRRCILVQTVVDMHVADGP
jgi:hypothetical protein